MQPFHCTTIVSNPFQQNTFVANLEGRSDCIVVDPGLEPEKIIRFLSEHNLEPAALLITHGHSDHIGGNHALKARWPDCQLIASAGDAEKLTDPQKNLSAQYGLAVTSPPADQTVTEGDELDVAGFELEVLEIPGHSPGHVVFVWKGASQIVVFGGDVLFAGSIGRCDFADGNFEDLAEAIHAKLFTLPDDTLVLPGHGPNTTVGDEKRANPFVGKPAGYQG
jgi:glyoxylase-like metal-dependent hydrolase (beta-lactamase superfamily II)